QARPDPGVADRERAAARYGTLADIRRRSEGFAQRGVLKMQLHDDVIPVARRLEPHKRTVVAVEPITYGTESFSKARAGNEYLDDSHSELPINVLYPANPRLPIGTWK